MEQASKFYILSQPDCSRPGCLWGDYGGILLSGMTERGEDGVLELARTGPFIPPISFPGSGDIIVTHAFRARLEASGLQCCRFRPVLKKQIVHLEWEKWDTSAPEPLFYPATGEPEDYILSQSHSPHAADCMGPVWELALEPTAAVERVQVGPADTEIHLVQSSLDGDDFFRAEGVGYVYVSDKARQWLQLEAPEWVSFEEALMDSELSEWRGYKAPNLDDELRDLLHRGKAYDAAIRYHLSTGCSLEDARAYIESL
jgi:hypothetical protein